MPNVFRRDTGLLARQEQLSKVTGDTPTQLVSTIPITGSCLLASLISIVPTANGEYAPPARPDLFLEMSDRVTGRSLLDSFFPAFLHDTSCISSKTWLALTACRATRATGALASNVSSTMRHFSSPDRRHLTIRLGYLIKDGLLGDVHLSLVDTYRCARIGQHPSQHSSGRFRPVAFYCN